MYQITLTEDQMKKLQKFINDSESWSDAFEWSETSLIDNSNRCDRKYYTENYDRIDREAFERKEQINEIKEIFGL